MVVARPEEISSKHGGIFFWRSLHYEFTYIGRSNQILLSGSLPLSVVVVVAVVVVAVSVVVIVALVVAEAMCSVAAAVAVVVLELQAKKTTNKSWTCGTHLFERFCTSYFT